MSDFYLRLIQGFAYSFALGGGAAIVCIPLAIVGANFLRKKNQTSDALLFALDVFIALPNQILLLTLAGVLGGGMSALLLSVFVTQMPGLIRHLRVHLVRAYSEAHVEAARALGVGSVEIFWKHVVGRLWAPLSVSTLSLVKRVILSEALLSFLGLGFDPLTPSLGGLLAEGKNALFLSPVYFLAPTFALVICLYVLQSFSDRFSTLFRSRGIRYL